MELVIGERFEVRNLERRLGRFREKEENLVFRKRDLMKKKKIACRANFSMFSSYLQHQRSAIPMMPPGFHYKHPVSLRMSPGIHSQGFSLLSRRCTDYKKRELIACRILSPTHQRRPAGFEVEIKGGVKVESDGGEEVDGGVEVDKDGGLEVGAHGCYLRTRVSAIWVVIMYVYGLLQVCVDDGDNDMVASGFGGGAFRSTAMVTTLVRTPLSPQY
ncbi:hypothetical protein V8G54_024183 [Vigna mungo]|uniref:Uncharacterized protein n=1 Tax=Vigna mungo TaxID=3915 RepID=A0AAQ3RR30_VIGMU